MLKKVIFFQLIFIFAYAGTLDKNYTLVYFKFFPTDLKIKVYTDNQLSSTSADKFEYFIPYIDNKAGEAKIFLVNSSQLERLEALITYQYKVVFYKVQKIDNIGFEVPVYSFKLSFQSNKILVKYDNLSEKVFFKDLVSDTYFLKDEKENDFNLSEKIRRVKIIGRVRKINEEKKTNYVDIESDETVSLVRKEDYESSFKIDNQFEVPLNREFLIGHYPYEIVVSEYKKFKPVGIILKSNEESKNLVIHFGEVWNYPYEYNIVFEKNPYFFEMEFDESLFELYYKIGKGKFLKSKNSLQLPLNKFSSEEKVQIKFSAFTRALKWLKNPVYNFSFSVSSNITASKLAEKIHSLNQKNFKLKEDAVFFLTPFKKTPFSIFTYPENARVEIKRLKPLSKIENDTISFNTTPIFINDFPYGEYIINVEWYDENKIVQATESKSLILNENSLKNQSYGIKFLTNKSVKIPYIEIYRPASKKNIEITTRKEEISTKNEINGEYFIQLIAFDKNYSKLNNEIKKFVFNYGNKHYLNYNEKIKIYLADKKIRGKYYVVLLSGPYGNDEAKRELPKFQRILKNTFIVRRNEVKNVSLYSKD